MLIKGTILTSALAYVIKNNYYNQDKSEFKRKFKEYMTINKGV